MGIYGMMRTGVAGMNAQANRLTGVADNVANVSTAGYKRTDTQFSDLVMPSTRNAYQSGGVTTTVRHDISGTAWNTVPVIGIRESGAVTVERPTTPIVLT